MNLRLYFVSLALCLIFSSNSSYAQINCDDSQPPVVFVHGFLASGDTWTTQIQRFSSNGHCEDRYFAFDWNTLSTAGADELLDQFIDSVLMVTEADKVHLVGHSAGGGRGYAYLSTQAGADKVISYAHIGSNPENGPAGPGGSTPTINIWSSDDLIVDGANIPGAENVEFAGLDHYQVATSAKTFEAMYTFFYGSVPSTTSIDPTATITINGRCITLGENNATVGAKIEAFEADEDGNPSGQALGVFDIDEDGNWGPLDVKANTYHLFKVTSDAPGFRNVIYYYEPFVRNNRTVYIRTFPPRFSLAGLLLAAIPNSDDQSVVSIFTSTQAVIHGRDQLNIEGYDLANAELAPASASMIALFCYDDANDGQGNGEPIGSFAIVPFLQGADIPIGTETAQTLNIEFNGSTIPVRNWRSASEGIVIAVFNESSTTTSIEDNTSSYSKLKVTPNPADVAVRVHLPGIILGSDNIIVTDLQGRKIPFSASALSHGGVSIDTRSFPVGTYILTVASEGGVVSATLQVSR